MQPAAEDEAVTGLLTPERGWAPALCGAALAPSEDASLVVHLPLSREDVRERLLLLHAAQTRGDDTVPLLVWVHTATAAGTPNDGVFVSYKLGQIATHKKVDTGALVIRPAARRASSRLAHVALDVTLPRRRFQRLQSLLKLFLPELAGLLREAARLPNFHARALTDEEVAERSRLGPLLYAAPWGGGLRVVVPHPRAGPQRRADVTVDWLASPAPALMLCEDGAPPRRVESLTHALGALGAFEAPQQVVTALKVIGAMKTRDLRSGRRGAPQGDDIAEEDEDDEAATQQLAAALTTAVRRRRERQAKRKAAEAAESAGAAPMALPTPRPELQPDGTEGALLPPLSRDRRTALLTMPDADARMAASAALDKLRASLRRVHSSGAGGDAATEARMALRSIGLLIISTAAEAVREALRCAGVFDLLIEVMVAAEEAGPTGNSGDTMPQLALPAPPQPLALPPPLPAPPPPAARVPSLRLARVQPRQPREPVSLPMPPASPSDDVAGDRARRISAFRDLNEDVEAEEAAESQAEAAQRVGSSAADGARDASPASAFAATPSAQRRVVVPRLQLGAVLSPASAALTPATPPPPPPAPRSSSGASAVATPTGAAATSAVAAPLPPALHASLLALLLALLVAPDGDTLEVEAAPAATASKNGGGSSAEVSARSDSGVAASAASPFSRLPPPPRSSVAADAAAAAAPARALRALQAHLRGASGAAALPALAPLAARTGAGAARLLRLCTPALFDPSLYRPRGRLGRGGFATVYAADVARMGAAAPRAAALKVTDVPPPPPLRRAAGTLAVRPATPADAAAAATADAAAALADALADAGVLRDVFAEVAAMERLAAEAPGAACVLLDYGCAVDCATLVLRRYACSLRAWRAAHVDDTGAAPPAPPSRRGTSRLYAAVYTACLDCVAAASAAGAVHLDIKADNFLIEPLSCDAGLSAAFGDAALWAPPQLPPGGPAPFRLVLADWGSASLRSAGVGTGRHAGSECVKAPEMLRAGARAAGAGAGRAAAATSSSARVGAPADVWAAGCLLHELFCGAPLFPAAEREWVRFFVHLTASEEDILSADAAQRLAAIHADVPAFVRAALARQPTARPDAFTLADRFATLRAKMERQLPPYVPPSVAAVPAEARIGTAELPPQAEDDDRTDATVADHFGDDVAAVPRLALRAVPVEVAPGLLLAPLAALRQAGGGAGVTHALRCIWLQPGAPAPLRPAPPQQPAGKSRRAALLLAARRGDPWREAGAATLPGASLVAAWAMPRNGTSGDGAAALDAGVTLLAAVLSRSAQQADAAAGARQQRVLLAPAPGAEAVAGALAAAWLAVSVAPPQHGALGAIRAVALLAPAAAPDASVRAHLAEWAQRTVAAEPRTS